MNELDWRRIENRLVEAHAAADPPLSPALWRGVEAALAPRRPRRRVWLAGTAVVVAAAAVALWFLPGSRPAGVATAPAPGTAAPRSPEAAIGPAREPAPVAPGPAIAPPGDADLRPAPPPAVAMLNIVIETRGAIRFAMSVDAGRIELEPCRGRFVNVTLLDGPHHLIELHQRDGRVEVALDGGAVMRGGVAHILVPADTQLVLSTRRGTVVVRGLGGPMQIDSESGDVELDTAPRLDPSVTVTSQSGAITWRGPCGRGCRVEARSQTGDITLRTPDRAAFTHGAVRGDSQAGRVDLQELSCPEPHCSSSPLPWRQPAKATPP